MYYSKCVYAATAVFFFFRWFFLSSFSFIYSRAMNASTQWNVSTQVLYFIHTHTNRTLNGKRACMRRQVSNLCLILDIWYIYVMYERLLVVFTNLHIYIKNDSVPTENMMEVKKWANWKCGKSLANIKEKIKKKTEPEPNTTQV